MDGYVEISVGVAAICSAMAGVALVAGKAWRGIKAGIKFGDEIAATRKNMDSVLTDVAWVKAQFKPNGGESLRDDVNLLKIQHVALAEQLDGQDVQLSETNERLEYIDKRMISQENHTAALISEVQSLNEKMEIQNEK